MKRPPRIYELLGKISDGTFLNEKEFKELETYMHDVEHLVPVCKDCQHSMFNHMVIDSGTRFEVECYETNECTCITPCSS